MRTTRTTTRTTKTTSRTLGGGAGGTGGDPGGPGGGPTGPGSLNKLTRRLKSGEYATYDAFSFFPRSELERQHLYLKVRILRNFLGYTVFLWGL